MSEKQTSLKEHWESIKDVGQLFSQKELKSFTSNFNEKLGSGAFGDVYKGQFPDGGAQVAVKVLKNDILGVTQQQFMAEVSTMGVTDHQNLIKLYGFCFEDDMKALVYEFMENGSLDKVLYGNHLNVDWVKLYDIAIGIAKGLSYLHESCQQKIIHHDIKAANVLLDSTFSPKITDFGLARLCNMDISQVTQSKYRGTGGFAAPEVCMGSKVITSKCDVYSFGMLLFEILRKKNNRDGGDWFPGKFWNYFENRRLDEILIECGINENDKNKANRISMVALMCGQLDPQNRPPMSHVVKMLEGEIEPHPPNTDPFPYYVSVSEASREEESFSTPYCWDEEEHIFTKPKQLALEREKSNSEESIDVFGVCGTDHPHVEDKHSPTTPSQSEENLNSEEETEDDSFPCGTGDNLASEKYEDMSSNLFGPPSGIDQLKQELEGVKAFSLNHHNRTCALEKDLADSRILLQQLGDRVILLESQLQNPSTTLVVGIAIAICGMMQLNAMIR